MTDHLTTISNRKAVVVEDASVTGDRHLSTATRAKAGAACVAVIEPSVSIDLSKCDRRCRGWNIIVRGQDALPPLSNVSGASDVGLPYVRQNGSEELFGTDALMQGEENHHRRRWGWAHTLYMRNSTTGAFTTIVPGEAAKAAIKRAIADGHCDVPLEYLKGAGEIAVMVRILHAIPHGVAVADFT